ncbi:TonB-dependent receptor [Chelatococcus reniformis]|uniref:TonB-dependent receptor n=1 Tax=Chelatococcus reniformis TaxID=1494448 RepID=A0A916UJI3_9HYPH|nr:TonB-dependent receptor [Chelatococcus reniformis]GGC74666.1 TonB-dependent receptor [Chelatococcus reniformis]
MISRAVCHGFAALVAGAVAACPASAEEVTRLDEIVVTATGRPEERSRIPGTVQVIDQTKIEHSTARSITDLLAENAVGFFSEWTPGQTSINIRGGSTDGQGKDFRSQVLVLINGHRAGTANLSKLSLAHVERIEIVRGPSSVIYGSQNIGGVINIILKTGRTAPGNTVEASGGNWGLVQGRAATGGVYEAVDWYFGVNGGQSDDYDAGSGGGRQVNTDWARKGWAGALGLQINQDHRVDVSVRSDGIYDAGFRGSGANYLSRDDRYNQGADVTYNGQSPDGRVGLMAQAYYDNDVDRFKWASPVQRGSNGLPAKGTAADFNRRRLEVYGTRVQPWANLWEGNKLILGWDWETSPLRSNRFREGVPGNPLSQIAPIDNNQTDTTNGFYAEDAQTFFDGKVTVRGGVRQTYGTTSFDWTPNLANQRQRTVPYSATTYAGGATYQALDWLGFRVGASSGFRAPTASELAADFTALGGGRIFGNPDLRPETAEQIEAGMTLTGPGWRWDTAVFQNVISDRIITKLRAGVANTSDYANNAADVVVRGIEMQFDTDVFRMLGRDAGNWRWTAYANGFYNFEMTDKGALVTANTNNVERMYKYQAAIGTRFGQKLDRYDWSFQVQGVLRGPMWYNTEENLLIPFAEPNREYIHRKDPFWIWNVLAEVEVFKNVKVFAGVNNVFNVNEHPIFIGLDKAPILADVRFFNGGYGTSMPGRQLLAGVKARF